MRQTHGYPLTIGICVFNNILLTKIYLIAGMGLN